MQANYKKAPRAFKSHKETSIPTLISMQEHLLTPRSAIAYLLANGAIQNIAGTKCDNQYSTKGRSYESGIDCPGTLIQTIPHDPSTPDYKRFYRWSGCKCSEKDKRSFVSISRNSFFEGSHVPTNVLLMLTLVWICGVKHTSIQLLTGLGQEAVSLWMKKILVAIQWDVLNDPRGQKIGGDKIHVQVDESKVSSFVLYVHVIFFPCFCYFLFVLLFPCLYVYLEVYVFVLDILTNVC